MPWPPVLRSPFGTLDIIFYVRGGNFMFCSPLPDQVTALCHRGVGPLLAPVVIEHARTGQTSFPRLRIRRLGVRVPPSAPSSTALSPIGTGALAKGFANNGALNRRDQAPKDVGRLSDLIPDHVRADPQRYRGVSMPQGSRRRATTPDFRACRTSPPGIPGTLRPVISGTP
jgi:hypothetical protein